MYFTSSNLHFLRKSAQKVFKNTSRFLHFLGKSAQKVFKNTSRFLHFLGKSAQQVFLHLWTFKMLIFIKNNTSNNYKIEIKNE